MNFCNSSSVNRGYTKLQLYDKCALVNKQHSFHIVFSKVLSVAQPENNSLLSLAAEGVEQKLQMIFNKESYMY